MVKIELILVGNEGTGKTSIAHRFKLEHEAQLRELDEMEMKNLQDPPKHKPTLGIEYMRTTVNFEGQNVDLWLWDTAGQEKYHALTKSYFRKADGIIIVFDLTNEDSLQQIQYWLDTISQNVKKHDIPKILLGNKKDLEKERKFSFEEISKLIAGHQMKYCETSAIKGDNIHSSISYIAEQSMHYIKILYNNPSTFVLEPGDNTQSSWNCMKAFFKLFSRK